MSGDVILFRGASIRSPDVGTDTCHGLQDACTADMTELLGSVAPDVRTGSRLADSGSGDDNLVTAVMEAFGAGYQRILVIFSINPTLPPGFIEEALRILRTPLSIVIGPEEEGGAYLLGINDFYPSVLAEAGSPHAGFQSILSRAAESCDSVAILPPWYALTSTDAVRRLQYDLACDETVRAPATRTCLSRLAGAEPGPV